MHTRDVGEHTAALWVENIRLGWRTVSRVRGWGARDQAESVGTALVRSEGPWVDNRRDQDVQASFWRDRKIWGPLQTVLDWVARGQTAGAICVCTSSRFSWGHLCVQVCV